MDIVAAPRVTARTVSVWLLIIAGIGNLAVVLANTLGDVHIISSTTLAATDAVLAFLTGAARFVAQSIALTNQEKTAILLDTANAPLVEGERPVSVTIGS